MNDHLLCGATKDRAFSPKVGVTAGLSGDFGDRPALPADASDFLKVDPNSRLEGRSGLLLGRGQGADAQVIQAAQALGQDIIERGKMWPGTAGIRWGGFGLCDCADNP